MIEFKLFGILIRIEPSFWFIIGLLGLFSFGLRAENAILIVALFVLAAFISILIHEMGHALIIRKYKLPTQIVLSNFGGYAMYPAGILNRKQSFLVSLAGPALQGLTGLAFFFALPYLNLNNNYLPFFTFIFFQISVFWALLNCLPVLPLDGGQMLAALMGPKRKTAVHLTSLITAGLVGAYAFVAGYPLGAIFMGMFGYQNFQAWQQSKR